MAEFIGSGNTNVNHARSLAEMYDSNLVSNLASNLKTSRFPFYRVWNHILKVFLFHEVLKKSHRCLTHEYKHHVPTNQPRSQRERGLHERAMKCGASLPCGISKISLPMQKSADDATVQLVDWPCLLPHDFVSQFPIGIVVIFSISPEVIAIPHLDDLHVNDITSSHLWPRYPP